MQKVCFDTGKPARTSWRVLKREANATRLELKPETGRSHQLRVHLKEIGHPILGDPFYAPDEIFDAALTACNCMPRNSRYVIPAMVRGWRHAHAARFRRGTPVRFCPFGVTAGLDVAL